MSKKIIFLVLLLSTGLTVLACSYSGLLTNKPEDVVKEYWNYVFKGELEKAKDLVCLDSPCSTSESRAESNAVAIDGKPLENFKGNINSCCKSEIIKERELVITEVREVRTTRKYALVLIRAEDNKKAKWQYINCLEKNDYGIWKMTRIELQLTDELLENDSSCNIRLDTK
jgi:hypothetical protein